MIGLIGKDIASGEFNNENASQNIQQTGGKQKMSKEDVWRSFEVFSNYLKDNQSSASTSVSEDINFEDFITIMSENNSNTTTSHSSNREAQDYIDYSKSFRSIEVDNNDNNRRFSPTAIIENLDQEEQEVVEVQDYTDYCKPFRSIQLGKEESVTNRPLAPIITPALMLPAQRRSNTPQLIASTSRLLGRNNQVTSSVSGIQKSKKTTNSWKWIQVDPGERAKMLYVCGICQKRFGTVRSLNAHQRKQHIFIPYKPY